MVEMLVNVTGGNNCAVCRMICCSLCLLSDELRVSHTCACGYAYRRYLCPTSVCMGLHTGSVVQPNDSQ
jgi:hypothetical protein